MTKETWIPLTDYASKYRVSVSTLRRRIKAEDIKYDFQEGKYYLIDQPMGAHPRAHRPSLNSDASSMGALKEASSKQEMTEAFINKSQAAFKNTSDEPILTAANKLLNELKKAYTLVLQEKEEQILHLKEEVTDLKTLVRVLEGENERLKPRASGFTF